MSAPVKTIRRWSALAAALLLLGGTLAACGGGSSDTTSSSSGGGGASGATTTTQPATPSGGGATRSGGGTKLAINAVESGGGSSLGFSERTLTARAGSVTLTLTNGGSDSLPHGIAIEGNGVDKDGAVVPPGGDSTVTVRLKPGRYTFYCPVGGHKDAGMKGTLTVQ